MQGLNLKWCRLTQQGDEVIDDGRRVIVVYGQVKQLDVNNVKLFHKMFGERCQTVKLMH